MVIYYFSICKYATTHTEDSVYIIGGFTPQGITSTIAKYNNDIWTIAGYLKRPRFIHKAIIVKEKTMIVGGDSKNSDNRFTFLLMLNIDNTVLFIQFPTKI